MKHLLLLSFSLLMTLHLSAQHPYPPVGKVQMQKLNSTILNTERDYAIYLPKSYTTDTLRQFPVLYLLHGLYGNHKDWSEHGHVADVANQVFDSGMADEMIIVMPDAGTDWYGYFNMKGWEYERFFFEEFMPAIEKRYRIKGDKAHRAIAGLSMGGGGTTAYAQKHPDLFASAYAMSALMALPEFGRAPSTDFKMQELNQSVTANSCIDHVIKADEAGKAALRSVRWFVDCGDDDFLFDVNLDFYRAMIKAHIPCQLRVRDGGHTWEYWHSALYLALPWVSNGFAK